MPASPSSRLSRETQRLLALTGALSRSGSRLEDAYWESQLDSVLNKLLLGKKNRYIESALEQLLASDANGYEILIEQAETLSESAALSKDGIDYDALLFCAPVVAWTRYQLPSVDLAASHLDELRAHASEHLAAPGAQIALLPALVGFDQMPQTFQETRQWTQRLALKALGQPAEACVLNQAGEQGNLLADARFVIGAIVVPRGEPIFRWQVPLPDEKAPTRDSCKQAWEQAASAVLTPIFTGCQVEYLQPDAYYVNSREADRPRSPGCRPRPISQAAICGLSLPPAGKPSLKNSAWASAPARAMTSFTAASGQCSARKKRSPTAWKAGKSTYRTKSPLCSRSLG
jgi:hypothetical protein